MIIQIPPKSIFLSLDHARILFNCGTPTSSSPLDCSAYKTWESDLKKLDCILLSHADLEYSGAIPWLISILNLSCPVYATVPVHAMAQITIEAALDALAAEGRPLPFTKSQVKLAFDKIIRVRFLQQTALPTLQGCTLTAYAAGHSLGAAIWKVALRAGEDVVYAVDFNHKKERHIDGIALEAINRPSLLLTSSDRIFCPHRNKKQRDASFVESCLTPLRAGGSVLVVAGGGVATRVLEILLLVEQTWAANKYVFPVFFLGPSVARVAEWAKSMLEWMGEGVISAFGANRANPFAFRHVQLHEDWRTLPAGPKVIISWDASLNWGPAKELILHGNWASHPENAILLTSNYSSYLELKTGVWNCIHRERIPLEGDELRVWKQQQVFEQQKRAADAAFEAAMQRRRRQGLGNEGSFPMEEEDEDEEAAQEEDSKFPTATTTFSSAIEDVAERERERLKRLYWYDYQNDCLGADAKFPLPGERRVKVDEYGEAIDDLISSLSAASTTGTMNNEKSSLDSNSVPEDNHHLNDEAPHKWLDRPTSVKINCRVGYLDFEGLSDGRSLKTVIARMNPRRLAIVGGSSITRQYMLQMCRISEEIGGGSNGTLVVALDDETLSVPIPQGKGIGQRNVRVDEEVLGKLRVAKCGPYEIAYLHGSLVQEGNKISQLPSTCEGEGESIRHPVLVGNVKLAQLKRDLLSRGMLSLASGGEGAVIVELAAGQLTVGAGEKKLVTVKKEGAGGGVGSKIAMEGELGAEYWAVRDSLYSQLVAV